MTYQQKQQEILQQLLDTMSPEDMGLALIDLWTDGDKEEEIDALYECWKS